MINKFILEDDEIEALYDYFIKRTGYISYEFDLLIIKLIKKLNKHILEKNREK